MEREFIACCKHNDINRVAQLIDKCEPFINRGFIEACKNNNLLMVKLLTKKGKIMDFSRIYISLCQ